jgi:predicted O-linked N-acetylglucosamine transferase (SPINDLY family)
LNTNQLIHKAFHHHQKNELSDAESIYQEILKNESNHFDALLLYGTLLVQREDFKKAVSYLEKGLSIQSDNSNLFYNLGLAYEGDGFKDKAISHYEKAIQLNPHFFAASLNLANLYQSIKLFDKALLLYEACISLNPKSEFAHSNKGNALQQIQQYEEAKKCYEMAINLNPFYANAHFNLGNLYQKLNDNNLAIKKYSEALTINPHFDEALYNKAVVFMNNQDYESANDSLHLIHSKNIDYLPGTHLHAKMFICKWDNFGSELNNLIDDIKKGKKSVAPWISLSLIDSAETQLSNAAQYTLNHYPPNNTLGPCPKRRKTDKINLAYYSSDFGNSAMIYLIQGLFKYHDKNKFNLFGFSFGNQKNDFFKEKIMGYFDHFYDCSKISDLDIAKLSRKHEIDIAINLNGYTKGERTGAFAFRCAPIQISYLGHAGTMGASYMDYIIADKHVIPESHQNYYQEKILYLPNCYFANSYEIVESDFNINNIKINKSEEDLPEDKFIFCCFNNSYKITPSTFNIWMQILKQTQNSILWLLENNQTASNNLKMEAQKEEVDPSRLCFAKRVDIKKHLARHKLADLFLDTLPYNAHTTSLDALWMNKPVIAISGNTFAGRVTASFLHALNLDKLIVTTKQDYINLAVEFRSNPKLLNLISSNSLSHKNNSKLFNIKKFTIDLEEVYLNLLSQIKKD